MNLAFASFPNHTSEIGDCQVFMYCTVSFNYAYTLYEVYAGNTMGDSVARCVEQFKEGVSDAVRFEERRSYLRDRSYIYWVYANLSV